jgi:large subunit ribosomal protein L6
MSRIGKNPVVVPEGVTLDISGQNISAKGRMGELSITLADEVEIVREEGGIRMTPKDESVRAHKMWGTARSVLNNVVLGVSQGFTRKLEINGVGYRAQVQGKNLVLQLGFSHEIKYPIDDGLKIECPDQTHITIQGADKQKVGQVASEIRGFRPPEPYKGKGIKYEGEIILRKEGKKK